MVQAGGSQPIQQDDALSSGRNLETMSLVASVPVPEEECYSHLEVGGRVMARHPFTILRHWFSGYRIPQGLSYLCEHSGRAPPHSHSSSRVARTAEIFLCVISARSPLTEAGNPVLIAT